ncbi:HAD family hydrolase [Terriglobus roseus]|uniref:Haloacid dehalogenase superfamily, subfamily IA, variant 3 with third motif having DD or ED/haloacid dehalogenase superfamily, subfamily IA, variant 1 with third motif having Dx(3-4)D or Dx(3-4)E n=1 Tax=Terriglobus roseus TaxID=392734 RepID=A0A1G7HDU9_9BACT|nr:HAD family hydrolase [Terriglobus roseus]SDE98484.1 haloacid dehalogenase superfamily, subfamily IA, variant 3 with third motif having DD or ED/haloacid dehalogenase superfamily, subfamily IA, variant 1 with third motif having Dx(3-4)D or Dx(3-4)E [Terriglobus roseus]
MALKAVLCDLDGTLLDSNAFHAEAWQRSLQEFGYTVSFEDVVKQIGKGGEYLLECFVPKSELPSIEKDINAFRKRLFHREYIDRIVPFADARRLLERMRQEGLRIAVATSSAKDDLEAFKTLLKIHDLVEEDTTADDADKPKPEPDIFQAALTMLKLQPSEAIALGDTPWDVEAARKAGMDTIAVQSGGWTHEELKDAGAVAVYVDVADLLRNFDTSLLCVR